MKRFVWIAIVLLLPMAAKAVEADSTEVVRIGRILILGNPQPCYAGAHNP